MNSAAIVHRIVLLILIITASLALSACESDPILAPQSEVAEEAGGSYGNTNLPVGGTNTTQNDVTDEQNGKTVGDRATITNPKRF